MSRSKRFVEVPTDLLFARLDGVGRKVEARGGAFRWTVSGREKVFEMSPPDSKGMIRVFTSAAVGSDTVRDCGKDAVRIVVGVSVSHPDPAIGERFKPIEKGTKILRTAPKNLAEVDRVERFLDRLVAALRDAYSRAFDVKGCPDCGSAMALRTGKFGAFYGCTAYPACKATAPA